MPQLNDLLQHGSGYGWLFIPMAIVLGALHGLEPGHSKTMMAAFIIAVRGTVTQAVQLGVSAALSHTAVVWAVALVGLSYGAAFNAEASEGYFQVVSAAAIIGIALWMLWRSWKDVNSGHDHDHHHDDVKRIDTVHGILALSIFEDGVSPRFRMQFDGEVAPAAGDVTIATVRPDGQTQSFALVDRGAYLESIDALPEPHEFEVRLAIGHGDQSHSYDVTFTEHDHADDSEFTQGGMDAHALAHARDIEGKFKGRTATTRQIILFGLTGGLIPCPAAITVLLVCLQLKNVSLGFALVLAFSLGLAITMVGAGVLAALSLRHVSTRWSGFGTFIHYAPLVSSGLVLLMGLYLGYLGLSQIA